MGGYDQLRAHPFFSGIDWQNLPNVTPPSLRKNGDTSVCQQPPVPDEDKIEVKN